jgi:hypothetical protein
MNDVIVASLEQQGGTAARTLIRFHNGQVLLVSADAVALYRHDDAVDDPLGNGLLGHELLPPELACTAGEAPVAEQRAGYVRLQSGAVLFIRPDGVALYENADDALRNRDARWLISFTP